MKYRLSRISMYMYITSTESPYVNTLKAPISNFLKQENPISFYRSKYIITVNQSLPYLVLQLQFSKSRESVSTLSQMAQPNPNPTVEATGLSYKFPDGTPGLTDIRLSLPVGSRTLLIGGKQTLTIPNLLFIVPFIVVVLHLNSACFALSHITGTYTCFVWFFAFHHALPYKPPGRTYTNALQQQMVLEKQPFFASSPGSVLPPTTRSKLGALTLSKTA